MKINWSEPGVPLSVIAHAAVLVASLVAMSSTQPFADAEETVSVELITADQLNAMTKGDKTAKEAQPTPKPRVDKIADAELLKPTQGADQTDVPAPPLRAKELSEEASAPPLPPPRPPEPVKPEPKPEPPKVVAEPPKPEPPKLEAEIPKPPEKPQPPKVVKTPEPPKEVVEKPKPPELDKIKIAQLIEEKRREEPPKPAKPPAKVKAEPDFTKTTSEIEKLLISKERPQATGSVGAQIQKTASLGTQTGNSPKLSPSMLGQLRGVLQDQFYKCFEAPPGVQASLGVVPAVRIQFQGPDGALAGRPVLTNPPADPGTRALAEAAVRAITRCAPYRIPAQFAPYFEEWKTTIFQIDLKDITG